MTGIEPRTSDVVACLHISDASVCCQNLHFRPLHSFLRLDHFSQLVSSSFFWTRSTPRHWVDQPYSVLSFSDLLLFIFWMGHSQPLISLLIFKYQMFAVRIQSAANIEKIRVKKMDRGCRHSSVDLSAPSILPPRVWVPSTPSMLFSI